MRKLAAAAVVVAGLSAVLVGHTTAGDAKVAVCHIPPGNPANMHTIHVGPAAVNAHRAHGDKVGACGSAGTPIPLPFPGGG
jgi:hypothetical protein